MLVNIFIGHFSVSFLLSKKCCETNLGTKSMDDILKLFYGKIPSYELISRQPVM